MSVPAASQQGFLFDLPHAALYAILHRAGLDTRELCKALLHVYGPLPRLTPRGPETPSSLLSALAAANHRHHLLRALDLSHVSELLTGSNLEALCRALPNLRALRLPSSHHSLTLACVAAATAHLGSLEALHAPGLVLQGAPTAEPIQGWSRLQELTLPGACLGPSTAHLLRYAQTLSRLAFQGHRSSTLQHVFQVPCLASLAANLPALRALELRMAGVTAVGRIAGAAQLRCLTCLTSLTLSRVEVEEGTSNGQLLQHVGALTNLRSLCLRLLWGDHQDPSAGHAWLARLPLLTSLRVGFTLHEEQYFLGSRVAPALREVASAVPHLPALQELHIVADDFDGQLSAAACARIASAGSTLRLLHLGGLFVSAAGLAQVLQQLTGLTCLRLDSVVHAGTMHFGWLTALTSLRELWVAETYEADYDPLPCELLAGLPNLRALALVECDFVDAPYLAHLCAAVPQLTSLNLGDSALDSTGLSSLQHLTNLEVLGLQTTPVYGYGRRWEHLRAPRSLRRCYMGGWCSHDVPVGAMDARVLGGGRALEMILGDWPAW